MTRSAVNSTHPFISGYWNSFLGIKTAWGGVNHFYPVSRLRISGVIPLLPYMPSWSALKDLYLSVSNQFQQYTSN
jgi:hypothetical protein